MRQYTFDQVTAHFKSKNMNVEVTQRGRGEVEIQAREIATTGAPDDQARVSARITEGGKVMLDVDRCIGNRCAEIVEDVAAAVGGAVETRHFKDAYYKPGRQRVKARTRT